MRRRRNGALQGCNFDEIDLAYYTEHYDDYVDAQNAGNEKIQHTERNRTMADLLKNSKICPEESIYQRTELCTGKAGGGDYMNVFEAVKAAVTTWQTGSLHALYDKSN